MRKIILGVAVSLDGYIEGPKGEYDWCFSDQDYGMKEFLQGIDAIFYGRKSFEMAGNVFPKKQAYVFSNTLAKQPKATTLVKGDIAAEVTKIKQAAGKDIWLFGGASLTSSLVKAGLVDEFWLSVHPIVLGAGKPCFEKISQRLPLKLIETKSYSTGLVSLKYVPA